MKRIIYVILLIPILILSCESNPEASFFLDTDEPVIGQEVFFNNTSQNAVSFEWDFGDGYISNEPNPVHIYQLAGTYDVVLTAFSKKGVESMARMTLNLFEPGLLVIEVLEYYSKDPVPGASVILYDSEEDWINQQQMIIEGFTAGDGIVVFADLDPIVHYVDVWEQNYDNYQLMEEDLGFIKTPKIVPNTVQWFIAYVDYVEHKKGDTKGERSMIIRKLERKAIDNVRTETDYSQKSWQELYDRRVAQ